MGKVIDLGKHSDRVKLLKMKNSPLYFAQEMLIDDAYDWKPTPFQVDLIARLSESVKLPTNKPK